MKLIQPAEISGKIMTLIDQAKTNIIIVSPYNQINNWRKLQNRIEKAKERGVDIIWYIRKDKGNAEQIKALGINPIEIENLHAKIYLNESNAVVTSMNLYKYSDDASLDIGYFISEKEQYDELIEFINNYLQADISNSNLNFFQLLEKYLNERISCEEIKLSGNSIICNKYLDEFLLIFEPKKYYFRVDLRIDCEYKRRRNIYNYLDKNKDILEKLIDYEINYGNQMLRLKIDFKFFENFNYVNWSQKEFLQLKPYLDNILGAYKLIIQKMELPVINH